MKNVALREKKYSNDRLMGWYSLLCASCGRLMFSPMLVPPASNAPLLAASMMPGPPPAMTANPAPARAAEMATVVS
ncbi:hypothetical protein G6F61_014940 [Rhizopus arrhizus]|nr:hypothetical protein G6F61_014940 [Rhizopus arrhizus]